MCVLLSILFAHCRFEIFLNCAFGVFELKDEINFRTHNVCNSFVGQPSTEGTELDRNVTPSIEPDVSTSTSTSSLADDITTCAPPHFQFFVTRSTQNTD